jgi:hypothetical protein
MIDKGLKRLLKISDEYIKTILDLPIDPILSNDESYRQIMRK